MIRNYTLDKAKLSNRYTMKYNYEPMKLMQLSAYYKHIKIKLIIYLNPKKKHKVPSTPFRTTKSQQNASINLP